VQIYLDITIDRIELDQCYNPQQELDLHILAQVPEHTLALDKQLAVDIEAATDTFELHIPHQLPVVEQLELQRMLWAVVHKFVGCKFEAERRFEVERKAVGFVYALPEAARMFAEPEHRFVGVERTFVEVGRRFALELGRLVAEHTFDRDIEVVHNYHHTQDHGVLRTCVHQNRDQYHTHVHRTFQNHVQIRDLHTHDQNRHILQAQCRHIRCARSHHNHVHNLNLAKVGKIVRVRSLHARVHDVAFHAFSFYLTLKLCTLL